LMRLRRHVARDHVRVIWIGVGAVLSHHLAVVGRVHIVIWHEIWILILWAETKLSSIWVFTHYRWRLNSCLLYRILKLIHRP
jgi:hypothetical protein